MPDGFSQHTLVAASTPNWLDGYVPPAAEWNAWWAQKLDIGDPIVMLGPYLRLVGGTLTGPLVLAGDPTDPLNPATKAYTDAADTALTSAVNSKLARSGDTMTGLLVLSGDPALPLHAATKAYTDAINASLAVNIATKVNLAGDTMTGPLVLAADPTLALGAVTKQYADLRVLRSGDTLTGPLILAADPTVPAQASTKFYVDAQTTATTNFVNATFVPLSQKAAASGVATLDATGKIPTGQLPGATTGTLSYKGGWNATTNTPTMASGALAGGVLQPIGNYYVVTVSGTTAAIDGVTTWVAGDWISSNGTIWQRVQNSTSPYLPLTGGVLSGALTTYGGGIITAYDPRVLGIGLAWQDSLGNAAAYIDTSGGFHVSTIDAAGDPTQPLQLSTKRYADNVTSTAIAGLASLYLALAGGTMAGPLVAAGGASTGQLDPRIPGVGYAWQDAAGNVGATVDLTGQLYWPRIKTDQLSVATFSTISMTVGLDNFGASDPRIPDFVYFWQDSAGNIVAGITRDGVFNATLANTGMLSLSGGTLTGPLYLAGDPTASTGAATKNYVDTHALPMSGGILTGPLVLAVDPTTSAMAANKGYVDQAVLNAGGSGPGFDPTFHSVNVTGGYYFNGGLLIQATAITPGAPGVPGIPNTHVGLAINSIGPGNVLVGYQTGGGQLTGGAKMVSAENTYIGMQVGANHSGLGQQNTALGCGTLRVDPNPGGVISIGSDASRNSTNNLRSTYVGTHAGRNGNNLVDLVYIGYYVGFGTDGVMPSVTGTVAIGAYALSDPAATSASNSVFVGYNVAKKGQSVPGNLLLGPNVGSSTLINGTGLIYLGASGAIDAAAATENHTFRLGNHPTNLIRATGINTATPKFFLDWLPSSTSYANDVAAKAGGVDIGQIYRNGSAVQICVA